MQIALRHTRAFATASHKIVASGLRDRLVQLIPEKQKELKDVSTKYANTSLGEVTVSQVCGGLRDDPTTVIHSDPTVIESPAPNPSPLTSALSRRICF